MKNKLFAFLSWLNFLALAILATIYLAWLAYPLEINWLELTIWTGLDREELLKNYNILLDYLTNPWTKELVMPDFPSSADGLKHFADVKRLFILAQAVFVLTAYPNYRFLRQSSQAGTFFLHYKAYLLAVLAPVLIAGMGILIGFDNFFTLFHNLLFPGDSTWLFDPATDPVINALPVEFFLHTFLVFFLFYEGAMLFLFALARRDYKRLIIPRV